MRQIVLEEEAILKLFHRMVVESFENGFIPLLAEEGNAALPIGSNWRLET